MARVLAIDYGSKRVGIAVTDDFQMIASGLAAVPSEKIFDFLKEYLAKENVAGIIVGAPKQMSGAPSEIAPAIEAFVQNLKEFFPHIEIIRIDERFTSKMAFQSMIESGLGKKKRRDKSLIDEIAATIMLQDYLAMKSKR